MAVDHVTKGGSAARRRRRTRSVARGRRQPAARITAAMDRVRSAFNKVVKSERYSRFTSQQAEDGERHVEVKLSDEAADDIREAEGQAGGSPTFRPAPQHHTRRKVCLALGALLIFSAGCLFGYMSLKPQAQSESCDKNLAAERLEQDESVDFAPPPKQLSWKDVTQLLAQKLTREAFEKTLRDLDVPERSAGGKGDMILANNVFAGFKNLDMDPWTDVHYVQLQKPDSESRNAVIFGSHVFHPEGYLAYSPAGHVEGKLVYGNYGRQDDLDVLQKKNVELKGCVLLLRSGKISFAEQVDNAQTKGASAVLIYPDVQDFLYVADTELYGHVHLGSGDPYTPGFPSFNHTQFPPTRSSGLPKIPAQTITFNAASVLLKEIGGPEPDASSGFRGGLQSISYQLGGVQNISVNVSNVLVNTEIHNVFGVIKGFTDPDRYVVLGAQRDAWGGGYARAAVGTSVLIELAKAVRDMVENGGFRPRRSLVFASWSAGEYGSVGATEWLEGYMSSIDRRVFTYISLDGVVMGRGRFIASASPLLHSLIESTMKEVKSPFSSGTLYDDMGKDEGAAKVLRPMTMDDPVYPFLAFSGIPSVSFHFLNPIATQFYMYYGTNLDSVDHLNYKTNHRTAEMAAAAAQFAGQMALRLVHDHLLSLDVSRYNGILFKAVLKVHGRVTQLSQSGQLKDVSPYWLSRARSSFQRAADGIRNAIRNTDLNEAEACRVLNDRLMSVEHALLSPYVSPVETPYRHLLLGQGPHTLASIAETSDMEQLRTQLALATWNLQDCANSMVGNIWDLDNEI